MIRFRTSLRRLVVAMFLAITVTSVRADIELPTDLPTDFPGGQDIFSPAPAMDPELDTTNPLDQAFMSAVDAFRARSYVEARRTWSELADADHDYSSYNLAVMSWHGLGGDRNPQEAIIKFKEGAAQEIPAAIFAVGVLTLRGDGIVQDAARAVSLFEKASALNYARATYNLAVAHLTGIGGANDPELGAELMEQVAADGLPRAQYDMGGLLYQGEVIGKDLTQARHWFTRASESGDAFAYYNLALMHLTGEGGVQDQPEGLRLLEIAAKAGVVPAQVRLAHEVSRGDRVAALMWFQIAAALGDEHAAANSTRLQKSMPAPDVEKALGAARTFRPQPTIEQLP